MVVRVNINSAYYDMFAADFIVCNCTEYYNII